jgi:hypothetical protein
MEQELQRARNQVRKKKINKSVFEYVIINLLHDLILGHVLWWRCNYGW